MERTRWLVGWVAGGISWMVYGMGTEALWAQQMTIGTPFHTIQEGFFEHIGVQWALQGRNWSIQFGGADLAQPTIGGFQPGAGIQGGFQFGGPGWSGQLQFSAAQGNTRTVTSTTPMVTIMNGATGYVADTSVSPFVIGLIPVVGAGGLSPWVGTLPGVRVAGPQMPAWISVPGTSKVERFLAESGSISLPKAPSSPRLRSNLQGPAPKNASPPKKPTPMKDAHLDRLRHAQQSTAGQPVLSVAEAKALRQAEDQQANQKALELFQRGQQAEQDGKTNLAILYYRMAAEHATGPLKEQIQARLAELQSPSPTR